MVQKQTFSVTLSNRAVTMLYCLRFALLWRRGKGQVSIGTVIQYILEKAADSHFDSHKMSKWNELLSDIYFAGKIGHVLGDKPESLTDEEWASYLESRFQSEKELKDPFDE